MQANIKAMVIEMSKAEAKEAGRVNTDAFTELNALRAAYPTFRIVIKTSKSKDNMKGLTVEYMEKYIKAHADDDGDNLLEFYALRGLDETGKKLELAQPVSYGELKLWFLSKYPEVEHFSKVDEIMAKAKAAREAHKATAKVA